MNLPHQTQHHKQWNKWIMDSFKPAEGNKNLKMSREKRLEEENRTKPRRASRKGKAEFQNVKQSK